MAAIYILIALVILIFLPIPIKISIIYDNSILSIKIYNHKIDLKTDKEIEKDVKKALSMDIHTKPIIEFLSSNRFKPTLRLKFDLVYGFGDAAYTGIFYGVIHTIYPFFLEYIKNFVKVKKSEFNINPQFDTTILNAKINSIIFSSLAQLIYIGFNLLRILKKKHIFK